MKFKVDILLSLKHRNAAYARLATPQTTANLQAFRCSEGEMKTQQGSFTCFSSLIGFHNVEGTW
jgi:hypothetical protein